MSGRRSTESTSHRWEKSILAARTGSFSALGQILDHYRNYLLRIANDELGSELLGKLGPSDIVQETFLDAARAFPRFEGETETELRGWLRQILINKVHDVEKRFLNCQKRDVTREFSLEEVKRGSTIAWDLPAAEPSNCIVSTEEHDLVRAAVSRLSDDHRRVIEMRHFEHQTFEFIAEALGRSTQAVRKLWGRAVEKLSRELGQ